MQRRHEVVAHLRQVREHEAVRAEGCEARYQAHDRRPDQPLAVRGVFEDRLRQVPVAREHELARVADELAWAAAAVGEARKGVRGAAGRVHAGCGDGGRYGWEGAASGSREAMGGGTEALGACGDRAAGACGGRTAREEASVDALNAGGERGLGLFVAAEANLALLVELVVPLNTVAGLADLDDGQAGAEGVAGRLRATRGVRGGGGGGQRPGLTLGGGERSGNLWEGGVPP